MKTSKPQEIIYWIIIIIASLISATSSTTYTPAVIGGTLGTMVGAAICGGILLAIISIFYGKFSRRRLLLFTSIFSVILLIGKLSVSY